MTVVSEETSPPPLQELDVCSNAQCPNQATDRVVDQSPGQARP